MSLKAKLEAVIYAAEEPVTLNQLAALFAADALEWKVEQDAAVAAQAAEDAAETPGTLPLLAEGLEYLGLEQTPAFYAGQVQAEGLPQGNECGRAEEAGERRPPRCGSGEASCGDGCQRNRPRGRRSRGQADRTST